MSIEHYAPIEPMLTLDQWDDMFGYPLGSVNECGCSLSISPDETITIKDQEKYIEDLLDVSKYEKLWYYQQGENDGDPWEFVVLHESGVYIFYEASCDYTGFDCQGWMGITISKDPVNFWNFGIDQRLANRIDRDRPRIYTKKLKTITRELYKDSGGQENNEVVNRLLTW